MTRPYAVKRGRKDRKRKRDDAINHTVMVANKGDITSEQVNGRGNNSATDEEVQAEFVEEVSTMTDNAGENRTEGGMEGIPVIRRALGAGDRKPPGVIFILEKASLEVAKVGKGYPILNSDDHAKFLMGQKKNPADYRPDILHQALLAILDSPLTKAGRLQALYVKTEKGVLFEIKPYVRIPRTFNRFCGLMSQLLQKLSITAVGKRDKLLNVIKNPVTRYLPIGSRKIGLSYSSEKSVNLFDYVAAANMDVSLVFVVGAMAHGMIDKGDVDDFISISSYPLSAAACLNRICCALEQKWKIQ